METKTIVTASYKTGPGRFASSRAGLDYQVHRPDSDTERQIAEGKIPEQETERHGFDREQDTLGYRDMLERADNAEQTYHYRLTLSPDPELSHHMDEQGLQEWTRSVMADLEERHPELDWTATIHADPEHSHVHLMAYVDAKLNTEELEQMRVVGDQMAPEIAAQWMEVSRDSLYPEPGNASAGGTEAEEDEGSAGSKKKVKALELGY